jgi:hypothetical protein
MNGIKQSEQNNSLAGRRVLIFQQRGWGKGIGRFLAKKLYQEGCKLAAITYKRNTHELIINQPNIKYDLVINNDEIMSRPKDYLAGDKFSLKEICERLGVDSIWPLVASLRNHTRSYKDKFYYGFKQNVPDEEIIDYVMAVYKYIKIIFDKFNPEVIISPNFVALSHIMVNLYALKRGVTMIGVADTKVKEHYIFTYHYNHSQGLFLNRVDELNRNKARTENRDKAKQYIKEFRESFKTMAEVNIDDPVKKSLKQIIKNEISPYYQCLRWYLKNPSKEEFSESIGSMVDYRPPKILLRDHYARKRNQKFIDDFNYYPFDKIKKFVYFPLQFQPEETIDVIAPYFSNQIETARLVAMSLPDDYTLVVKEHPGMAGLRPGSYLEKVARTVNVKLIDYRIPSEDVLKRADLIISPNGTTLVEAAFYRKPAIQLGNLGTTLKLPNIFKHTDMTTITEKIKQALEANLETEEYERRLENYVAAVYDTGFNYKYAKAWVQGGENMETLWQIYKKEVERVLLSNKKI